MKGRELLKIVPSSVIAAHFSKMRSGGVEPCSNKSCAKKKKMLYHFVTEVNAENDKPKVIYLKVLWYSVTSCEILWLMPRDFILEWLKSSSENEEH